MLSDNNTTGSGPSSPSPVIWRFWPSAAVETCVKCVCKLWILGDSDVETTEHDAPLARIKIGSCASDNTVCGLVVSTETVESNRASKSQASGSSERESSCPQATFRSEPFWSETPKHFLTSDFRGHSWVRWSLALQMQHGNRCRLPEESPVECSDDLLEVFRFLFFSSVIFFLQTFTLWPFFWQ